MTLQKQTVCARVCGCVCACMSVCVLTHMHVDGRSLSPYIFFFLNCFFIQPETYQFCYYLASKVWEASYLHLPRRSSYRYPQTHPSLTWVLGILTQVLALAEHFTHQVISSVFAKKEKLQIIPQNSLGLEKWFSDQEHVFIWQRILVWFSGTRTSCLCNSGFMGSNTLWPLCGHLPAFDAYKLTQPHIHNKKIMKFFLIKKTLLTLTCH